MTLLELWMVVKRRWVLMVVLPVVCALACGAWLLLSKEATTYSAKAQVVANSQAAYVMGAAMSDANAKYGTDEDAPVKVTAKVESGTTTVSITATGEDADECVDAVNELAEAANESATDAFESFENPYSGQVVKALEAEESEASSGGMKYLLVAVLAGLFVAVCIAVVLDMRSRPVKTPEGVQDAVELPVLELLPAKSGERLLANVRFAAGGEVSSVLVVPTGDAVAADEARGLVADAARAEGSTVAAECAAPLSESMAGAYASRDVDSVVVAVRQWADSLPALESTVAELKLAGANVVGIAFAKEQKAK